jgi:predicted AlkP superfamily pyrophosphatase or phosphodiesterase
MNGGTTAFVGSDTWHELFGSWMNYSISFRSAHPGEATVAVNVTSGGSPVEDDISSYSDSIASAYATQIANRFTPTLMVVHFSETDEIGHEVGPTSEANNKFRSLTEVASMEEQNVRHCTFPFFLGGRGSFLVHIQTHTIRTRLLQR